VLEESSLIVIQSAIATGKPLGKRQIKKKADDWNGQIIDTKKRTQPEQSVTMVRDDIGFPFLPLKIGPVQSLAKPRKPLRLTR
jgi:hypothetical protein